MSDVDYADDGLVASVSEASVTTAASENGGNQLAVPFNPRCVPCVCVCVWIESTIELATERFRSPLRSSLVKSGTRTRSPARKTVSFSSLSSEKKVSNGERPFGGVVRATNLANLGIVGRHID